MGRKKYFCDFCNRSFNDDKIARQKHLNSVNHLSKKKEHYDTFRDPETILEEECSKKPCRKYHLEGSCQFGGHCTFTHYSKEDLDAIRVELFNKKQQQKWNQPTIESWLLKYNQEVAEKNRKSQRLLWSCEVPAELLQRAGLYWPPSLRPFHIQEFMDSDLETWG